MKWNDRMSKAKLTREQEIAKEKLQQFGKMMCAKIEPYYYVVDEKLFREPEERIFFNRIKRLQSLCKSLIEQREYLRVLKVSVYLNKPATAFLDNVRIKTDDEALTHNRYALLWMANSIMTLVADFSKL